MYLVCSCKLQTAFIFLFITDLIPQPALLDWNTKDSWVSHLANKRMKSLLNLAALTAKKTDMQIKSYYERKLNEGKNPMLILNNIRNKLVARIFATVKRQTPYVFTMKFAA